MKRPFAVYLNGLCMNRFITRIKALELVASFAERGLCAVVKEECSNCEDK